MYSVFMCLYVYDILSSGASVIKSCLGFLIKLSPDKDIINSQSCGCHICGVLITWPNPNYALSANDLMGISAHSITSTRDEQASNFS